MAEQAQQQTKALAPVERLKIALRADSVQEQFQNALAENRGGFIASLIDIYATDRINSRFQYARFKLFDQQVNGGLTECCETTINGVPYATALNKGARINAGLDIINTLSEHFSFSAPVFIDNAEAVTRLIPINAQMIRLVVSEADKSLRVEVA